MARQGHVEFGEVEESRGSCYALDVNAQPDWDIAIKLPAPSRRRCSRLKHHEAVFKELPHPRVIAPKFVEECAGHDVQLCAALQSLNSQRERKLRCQKRIRVLTKAILLSTGNRIGMESGCFPDKWWVLSGYMPVISDVCQRQGHLILLSH